MPDGRNWTTGLIVWDVFKLQSLEPAAKQRKYFNSPSLRWWPKDRVPLRRRRHAKCLITRHATFYHTSYEVMRRHDVRRPTYPSIYRPIKPILGVLSFTELIIERGRLKCGAATSKCHSRSIRAARGTAHLRTSCTARFGHPFRTVKKDCNV